MILKVMYSFDLISKTDENLEICLVYMDSFDWKNDDYQVQIDRSRTTLPWKNDDYQLQIDRSKTTLPPFNIWGSEPYLIFICRFPVNYLNPL